MRIWLFGYIACFVVRRGSYLLCRYSTLAPSPNTAALSLRDFSRFVRVFTPRSSGFCKDFCPHIWLHACSFGEIKSLEPIIQALATPTRNILLTTTTQTGFDLAQSSYTSEPTIRVEFLPFEIFLPFYARRLKQLQALVVTEAELWLELFHTAKALGAQTLLINARISTRSYPKYRRFRAFYRVLFSYIDKSFAQTQADTDRLSTLGARNIHIFGNLKLLSPIHISHTYPKPKNRLVIVAASTHRGRKELVLQAFSALKKVDSSKMDSACGLESPKTQKMDSSLLILAPRHPERFDEVSTLLESSDFSFTRFSKAISHTAHQAIYKSSCLTP